MRSLIISLYALSSLFFISESFAVKTKGDVFNEAGQRLKFGFLEVENSKQDYNKVLNSIHFGKKGTLELEINTKEDAKRLVDAYYRNPINPRTVTSISINGLWKECFTEELTAILRAFSNVKDVTINEDNDIGKFLPVLKSWNNVHRFTVFARHGSIDSGNMRQILNHLKTRTSLKAVIMENISLQHGAVDDLKTIVKNNPGLCALNIRANTDITINGGYTRLHKFLAEEGRQQCGTTSGFRNNKNFESENYLPYKTGTFVFTAKNQKKFNNEAELDQENGKWLSDPIKGSTTSYNFIVTHPILGSLGQF